MKAKTKLLVILSDLHVGSTVGLWPPGFVANEGFPIGQNAFQKLLWSHWKDCLKWIKRTTGDEPFELLLNGDLVDGIHHRTLQVMSMDVADQSVAVLKVLGELAKETSGIYLTKGTECHTRNDELRIGAELEAHPDPSTGHHAWDRLELEYPGGIVFAATHHTPTTSRPYLEAAQHSIQLGVEIMERARNGKKVPRIIARAHRHLPGVWNDGRLISITTGAWQGLTRYGRKVVPHAVPAPSCAILDFRGTKPGELPTVHQKAWITE